MVEYPSTDTFSSMQKDEAYRKAVKHMQITLNNSRLITMAPKNTQGLILLSETSISLPETYWR